MACTLFVYGRNKIALSNSFICFNVYTGYSSSFGRIVWSLFKDDEIQYA